MFAAASGNNIFIYKTLTCHVTGTLRQATSSPLSSTVPQLMDDCGGPSTVIAGGSQPVSTSLEASYSRCIQCVVAGDITGRSKACHGHLTTVFW
jgi:hypothetical protein